MLSFSSYSKPAPAGGPRVKTFGELGRGDEEEVRWPGSLPFFFCDISTECFFPFLFALLTCALG